MAGSRRQMNARRSETRRVEAAAQRIAKDQDALIPGPSMVASAVRMPGSISRIYVPSQPWQEEAYRHFGICGEAQFAANYFGHAMSKVKLFAGKRIGGKTVRSKPEATESLVLDALFNGGDGQEAMLSSIGIHLTVAGECYIVGREAKGDYIEDRRDVEAGSDIWEVVPVTEMHKAGSKWTINYGDGFRDVILGEDDVVIRLWIPDPSRRMYATSPFKALLPVLSEIEYLTKNIFSQITSRLTGAGILFLPQGMSFPPPPEVDGKPQQVANEAAGFTLVLGENMMEALDNDGSPVAKVPMIVTAPDDTISKVHWQTFWSDMDKATIEMRKDAVMRFALGMDLPADKVIPATYNSGTGGGNSNGPNHWGMWQVDEEATKMHVEPMCDVVVSALTITYLRPNTEDDSVVGYDTTALHIRPDRSKESIELFLIGELKASTMRRENGFDEEDAPTPEDTKAWLLRKVASGSATPEMIAYAAAELGLALPVPEKPSVSDGPDLPPEVPREARPDPSIEDHPVRELPDAAALLFASDALVYRALERAGNRLRQSVGQPPNCRAYETHTLVAANGSADRVLSDAFSTADLVLDGLAEPAKVVPVLEAYCRSLLASQEPHSRPLLEKWLEKADLS